MYQSNNKKQRTSGSTQRNQPQIGNWRHNSGTSPAESHYPPPRPQQWRDNSDNWRRQDDNRARQYPSRDYEQNHNTTRWSNSNTFFQGSRRDPTPFSNQNHAKQSFHLEDRIPRRRSTAQSPHDVVETAMDVDNRSQQNLSIIFQPMVLEKEWSEYEPKEQYMLIFPEENPGDRFPKLNFPPDYEHRKEVAVTNTLQYIDDELFPLPPEDEDDEESKDSDEEEDNFQELFSELIDVKKERLDNRMAKLIPYKDFVKALPYCTPLDIGYLAFFDAEDADEFCWCPCRRNKFWRWREHFGVSHDLDFNCNTNKFRPNALRKHLEDKMKSGDFSGILHRLVYKYLGHIYDKYIYLEKEGRWLKHKAHCNPSDKEFKEAEAAQNKHMKEILEQLQKDLAEAKRIDSIQRQVLAKLEKVNFLKAQQLREKDKAEKEWRKRLDIKETTVKVEINQDRKMEYENMLKEFFDLYQTSLDVELNVMKQKKKFVVDLSRESGQDVEATVMEPKTKFEVDLSLESGQDVEATVMEPKKEFVVDLSRESGKDVDTTVMEPGKRFGVDLKEWVKTKSLWKNFSTLNRSNWLRGIDVRYESVIEVTKGKDRKDLKAIDEGGPSRAFFSDMWRQLRGLTVIINNRSVPLFLDNDDCIPQENEVLQYMLVGKMDGMETEIQEEVRPYYRLIGRILLANIRMASAGEQKTSFTIGKHVLPRLYRYYLFYGIEPQDERYPLSHLCEDVLNLKLGKGYANKSQHDAMQEYAMVCEVDLGQKTIIEGFRTAARTDFIGNRSWALDALKEGLTLDSRLTLKMGFLSIPIEYIDAILFAAEEIRADDVIKFLVAEYCDECSFNEQWSILGNENGSPSGFLPDFLRKREKENKQFATIFVEFATGSRYLPQHNPDFKIIVEFNAEELKCNNCLVVSHTCVNTLKLPGSAYDGDPELFEQKISESIEYFCSGVKFDMG